MPPPTSLESIDAELSALASLVEANDLVPEWREFQLAIMSARRVVLGRHLNAPQREFVEQERRSRHSSREASSMRRASFLRFLRSVQIIGRTPGQGIDIAVHNVLNSASKFDPKFKQLDQDRAFVEEELGSLIDDENPTDLIAVAANLSIRVKAFGGDEKRVNAKTAFKKARDKFRTAF